KMLDVIVDAFGHHSAQKDLQKAMHTSDPKKRDELLFHSLLNFLQGSDKEGVQQALKAGADVNRKTQNGVTPLKIAENFEIALILLKANADIKDLDANRKHPPEVKLEQRKTNQEYLKANGLAQNKEPLKVSEKEKAMLAFDEVPDIITYKTLELLAKKSMKKAATDPD
ncbi:MAG: hypothetical protein J6S61_02305, partial [Elusimicrobiaceae bacterium]|nr:hypothetical protein [Elusimicrobiaceae bacterium]